MEEDLGVEDLGGGGVSVFYFGYKSVVVGCDGRRMRERDRVGIYMFCNFIGIFGWFFIEKERGF